MLTPTTTPTVQHVEDDPATLSIEGPALGLHYRADEPGDLTVFLRGLLEQPNLALEVKIIKLDVELDGQEFSGVLELAEQWGVEIAREWEMKANNGEYESEEEEDCNVKIHPTITNTAMATSSFTSSKSDHKTAIPTTNPIYATCATAFEDLAAAKRLACISDSEELPTQMYIDLLSTLLSVCRNVEILMLPEEWYEMFDEGVFRG